MSSALVTKSCGLLNNEVNFTGGKVFKSLKLWESLSSDNRVLDIVKGKFVEFSSPPVQDAIPFPLRFSRSDQNLLDVAVRDLIDRAIVELCGPLLGPGFYSNVFPVMKKDGLSARIILNLSDLNLCVVYVHFKMDTINDILELVFPGCYFATVDLSNAYFSVYVRPEDRDWFRFMWQGQHYRFTSLPQGFSSAPRVFTKLLKPAFAFFRKKGMITACYIDDAIFMAASAEGLSGNVDVATHLLDRLGLTVNVRKSVFSDFFFFFRKQASSQ